MVKGPLLWFSPSRPIQQPSWGWSWSQIIDQPQKFPKQVSRYGNLGHLEDGIAGVGNDFGADLDHLLAQRGDRPTLGILGPY